MAFLRQGTLASVLEDDPQDIPYEPPPPPAPPGDPGGSGDIDYGTGGTIPGTPPVPGPEGEPDFGTFNPQYGGPYSPEFSFGEVPEFEPTPFGAPTLADALSEPGYAFRLQSGREALESSAAARGVLRTGGTLKDLIEYGQSFAAQEYSNVFDRALRTYGAQYQSEKDIFAPRFADWQMRAQAERERALAEFGRYYDVWRTGLDWEQGLQDLLYPGAPPSGPAGGGYM